MLPALPSMDIQPKGDAQYSCRRLSDASRLLVEQQRRTHERLCEIGRSLRLSQRFSQQRIRPIPLFFSTAAWGTSSLSPLRATELLGAAARAPTADHLLTACCHVDERFILFGRHERSTRTHPKLSPISPFFDPGLPGFRLLHPVHRPVVLPSLSQLVAAVAVVPNGTDSSTGYMRKRTSNVGSCHGTRSVWVIGRDPLSLAWVTEAEPAFEKEGKGNLLPLPCNDCCPG